AEPRKRSDRCVLHEGRLHPMFGEHPAGRRVQAGEVGTHRGIDPQIARRERGGAWLPVDEQGTTARAGALTLPMFADRKAGSPAFAVFVRDAAVLWRRA